MSLKEVKKVLVFGHHHTTRLLRFLQDQLILDAAITSALRWTIHERTNGNIQSVITKARGFKSFDRFRLNVLFYFGKLDLLPTKVLV